MVWGGGMISLLSHVLTTADMAVVRHFGLVSKMLAMYWTRCKGDRQAVS